RPNENPDRFWVCWPPTPSSMPSRPCEPLRKLRQRRAEIFRLPCRRGLGRAHRRFYARCVRLLCISDVHGHADALAAVLATAERRGYGKLLVAGDLCFPGPAPLETWRRLTQAGATCVQGSSDRALATLDVGRVRPRSDHERARLDRLAQVRSELGDLILAR